jgi:O-antigen/teichoic acid export membrane protein
LKRKFISNLSFLLGLNLIIKPIYVFGIDRVVQNNVGTEIYGNYFFLFNLVLIFQILLDMGIESFSRREIARYNNMAGKYLSGLIPIKFVLGVVYFILCSVVGLAWGLSSHQWLILMVLMGNQFMASFTLYLRSTLGGLHLFKQESFISVLDRTIMIIVCGVLLYTARFKDNFRLDWFLLSLSFSYFITLFIAFITLQRKVKILPLRINIALYIPIIRQLLPYALLVLLQSVYYRIDTLFLDKLLFDGHEQVGIYAHAWRIIEFLANYALLFSMVLLPIFSRMIKMNERPYRSLLWV